MCKTLIADSLSPFFDRFHCLFWNFRLIAHVFWKSKKFIAFFYTLLLHFYALIVVSHALALSNHTFDYTLLKYCCWSYTFDTKKGGIKNHQNLRVFQTSKISFAHCQIFLFILRVFFENHGIKFLHTRFQTEDFFFQTVIELTRFLKKLFRIFTLRVSNVKKIMSTVKQTCWSYVKGLQTCNFVKLLQVHNTPLQLHNTFLQVHNKSLQVHNTYFVLQCTAFLFSVHSLLHTHLSSPTFHNPPLFFLTLKISHHFVKIFPFSKIFFCSAPFVRRLWSLRAHPGNTHHR